MMLDAAILGAVAAAMLTAATPLLFTALGELITERAGVLNLGAEGMMLAGAVAGFAASSAMGGDAFIGSLAAMAAGAGMALLFAVLALTLLANQVASGLALTLFGVGLSALAGQGYVGHPLNKPAALAVPGLSELPLIGPALFAHDGLVYLALVLVPATHVFLTRSRWGLILRAVGENHHAAHALGYSVIKVRYAATLYGGALAGLGGAYLSLVYTPMWTENMTAGRGWIALALVVFAAWSPSRTLLGALLFGGLTIAQLHAQGAGLAVPSQLLAMLPYLATIAVLVVISRDAARIRLNAPACLGKSFHPDH